jgi:uncharacterized protein YutE (UPF0331/DUF86 family)
MTDVELVFKKLVVVESCVRDLRDVSDPSEIKRSIRTERFVEHTLQIAIQACLDVASHVISHDRLGEPSTNREMFRVLAKHGYIDGALADTLANMAGFRNLLVHGYDAINLDIVEAILRERLADLLTFCERVRQRLEPAAGQV